MDGVNAAAEFDALLLAIGDGVPNTEQYQRMSGLVLDVPEALALARMDPFRPDYKPAAMALYLTLRGRAEQGYVVARDEAGNAALPANLWTDLVPWSFRDAAMASEHLLAWGHIFRHLALPAGGALLEYGPGSGQILLMAARLGYRAYGVDIDAGALAGVKAQAAHLGLSVAVECAAFGAGFDGEAFDTILFYEAFHHAFDFDDLLVALHRRLKPGGRVVLCGEPIVGTTIDAVPYPWGPRLDALSVFCMRRFGWMELGFTHDFFMQSARRAGWTPTHHPFPAVGRAAVYTLEPATASVHRDAPAAPSPVPAPTIGDQAGEIRALRDELAAMRASTSWRLTRPFREAKERLGGAFR